MCFLFIILIMKRTIFLSFALLMCIMMYAGTYITFDCSSVDPKVLGNPMPKSPIEVPLVYIDDYTLSFEADHPEYVLSIKDEEDEVVYTTVVSSSQTQVILPSTLSGEYKIELVMGNWLFTGWINL